VMDLANAAALEAAAGAMGLEVRRDGRVIAPSLAFSGDNQCTPLIELETPAPTGKKPVRRGFVVRARGVNGHSDKDSFVTLCE